MMAPVNMRMTATPRLWRTTGAMIADTYGALGGGVIALAALTLLSAVLEGLSLALLLPLFTVLGFGGATQTNVVTDTILSLTKALDIASPISAVAILLLTMLAFSAVAFLAQAYYSTKLQADYVAVWQKRIFSAVIKAGWPFIRRRQTGDLVNAVTTETVRVGGAFYQINLMVTSATFLVAQIAIAWLIAPAITIAILVLAFVLFALTQSLVARALRLGTDTTAANAQLQHATMELLGAMKLIKATAHESDALAVLDRSADEVAVLTFKNQFDIQLVRAVFEYVSGAAVALLLLIGPLWLGVEVGAVVIVVAMFVRLFPKVTGLRQCLQSIGLALPAFDALRAIERAAQAAQERTVMAGEFAPAAGPAHVVFDNVVVHGDNGEALLSHVSCAFAPGTLTALVGPTGAGKTTLIDCALGLNPPFSGDVLTDGRPLADMAQWRRALGYLGQEPMLFAASVRDNVKWGREDVDDAAVTQALRQACADFVFERGGLDVMIGQGGGALSGGERQRLALARALAGKPRFLVLDEATSALDPETELDVMRAVHTLRGQTTVLCITHRFGWLREADQVLVLDGGRIVESGTADALQAARGRFAAMAQSVSQSRSQAASLASERP